ncbi:MAG: hypothetical protein V7L11_23125 [Nostoc sp.]
MTKYKIPTLVRTGDWGLGTGDWVLGATRFCEQGRQGRQGKTKK